MEALGAPLDPHRDFETVLEPNDAFQADQEAGISEANSVASSIYYVDGNAVAA